MHGIPVLIKDNIDTADRMKTTAGSFALGEVTPTRDASLVERLRDAGAVILGKANLSEWANFRSTRSSSGWSARGGQCRNPYALERSPCGSSSGSGVAVSANLCAVAVGTETDGSIVCPSSVNGIVGIKPTVGLVSRSGVVPISHTQDTPGPMARTVADAAALLSALAGPDEADAATGGRALVEPDYAAFVDPDGLRGARIGVARHLAGFHDRVDRLFDEALDAMRDLGAELVDPVEIQHVSELEEPELEVLLLRVQDRSRGLPAGAGAGAAVPNARRPDRIQRVACGRRVAVLRAGALREGRREGPVDRARRTSRRSRRAGGSHGTRVWTPCSTTHRLDAVVAPSNAPAWLTDYANGDHYIGGNSTPAAVAGYPNVTVPMGFAFDLPIGISFMGRPWSEAS